MLIAQIVDLNKDCVEISRPYLLYFPRNRPSKRTKVDDYSNDSASPKVVIKFVLKVLKWTTYIFTKLDFQYIYVFKINLYIYIQIFCLTQWIFFMYIFGYKSCVTKYRDPESNRFKMYMYILYIFTHYGGKLPRMTSATGQFSCPQYCTQQQIIWLNHKINNYLFCGWLKNCIVETDNIQFFTIHKLVY